MFERERTLYAFLLGYVEKLVAEIADEDMTRQPTPGVNHPAWQLGHLSVVADSGCGLAGRPRVLRLSWHKQFGPGSTPDADRSLYPSKEELLTAYRAGHARLAEAVADATPETIDRPHPLEFLKPGLATVGDLLAHLLTTHEAMHVGHLSSWRRQMGLPHLF